MSYEPDRTSSTSAMNESKVVIYKYFDRMYTREIDCVTHADYKALEERSQYFRKEWNKAEGEVTRLEEELASLKARVRELVQADKAFDIAEAAYRDARREKGNWNVNPVAHNHPSLPSLRGAQERRRLALEALK